MSYCVKCGVTIDVSQDFCSECGTPIKKLLSEPISQTDIGSQRELDREKVASNNSGTPLKNAAAGVLQGFQSAATELEKSHLLEKLSQALLNPASFVLGYTMFMIPTYILPYVGSNSSVLNTLGAAAGVGFNPALYVHIAALAVLVLISWLRGKLINKGWLGALPLAASMFDLLPGLSLIPMIPSVLHVVTIILGVKEEPARK